MLRPQAITWCGIVAVALFAAGCQSTSSTPPVATPADCMPHELRKTVLPPYVIESPDVLLIEAIHAVPKQPYLLQPYDTIVIQASGTPQEAPIAGLYLVGADGSVALGAHYQSVNVAGKTVNEARSIIWKYLTTVLTRPEVAVSLADSAARQRIAGPHLVAMDGTVTLGAYGRVSVAGMPVDMARAEIHQFLLQFFDSCQVSVEVMGYNSKVYYIVVQGAGLGDGVYRFPMTGNETVLDAISQVNGTQRVSSKKIWVARPTENRDVQRLEVNWEDITANAYACSNYQILPGDRIFISEDKFIAADTALGKLFAPMERVMGFSILGVGTVTRFSGPVLRGGGNANASF